MKNHKLKALKRKMNPTKGTHSMLRNSKLTEDEVISRASKKYGSNPDKIMSIINKYTE